MISFLRGKILNKGNGFVIIAVADIGYKVFVNTALYAVLEIGSQAEIYTHQHIREDAVNLYGFKNLEELELFELFLSVSGIGPKTALGVLAAGPVNEIKESIAHGDAHLLTKVSGIGKKTAERAILELREKVGYISSGAIGRIGGEEIDALMALGYSMSEAREALCAVDSNIKESGARIKQALKKLAR